MKIAVIVDSCCGMNQQEAEAAGLFYLPLQILDEENNETYLDGVNISCDEIFEMIRSGKMLKTSLPPLGLVEGLFKKLKLEGYEHLIGVPLTSGISGTMQSWNLCAEEVGVDLTCIETYTTSYIQKYIALSAKRLVDEGCDFDTIINRLKDSVKHSNTLFIPEDLDHLKRGGRLTPMAAALGGMLKIKPILKLNVSCQGKIDTFAKVRTMKKAMQTAVDAFAQEADLDENYVITIMHTMAEDSFAFLQEIYFQRFSKCEQHSGYLSPVISAHTGVGSVGIQYIKKV